MHGMGISHRDLKPENVLIKEGHVRICDVGSSKVLDETSTEPQPMNTPYVVSRYYRAPELILGSNRYDLSIDIWAAGCIIFELMTKRPMFPGESEGTTLLEIQQIIGRPSQTQLAEFQLEIKADNKIMEMFHKMTHMEKSEKLDLVHMLKLLPNNGKDSVYAEQDLNDCANLIEKCI